MRFKLFYILQTFNISEENFLFFRGTVHFSLQTVLNETVIVATDLEAASNLGEEQYGNRIRLKMPMTKTRFFKTIISPRDKSTLF